MLDMTATANHQPPVSDPSSEAQHKHPFSGSKWQKSSHRASIACGACRGRRIRGESGCVQCKRAGTQCIFKNDDERRRPISRAYTNVLTDRIALLESMLKEKGTEPPPIVYPPKTTRGTLFPDGDGSPARRPLQQLQCHNPIKNDSAIKKDRNSESESDQSLDEPHPGSLAKAARKRESTETNVGTPIDDKKDDLVSRLLSTRGHLSFDQLSGRLRFYGGTVNCHIYSELNVGNPDGSREAIEQARRTAKVIRSLSTETHEYLMELFWLHYNDVLHVVHEEAFNDDRKHDRTHSYSGFLHVCILAMGYRFADKTRPDIVRLSLPNRESTLHREAKGMLDLELERPGGIPFIAGLLILGDAEAGVGRDNVGWMLAGMAMRLCYDIGLQLDSRQSGISEREMDIRRMTLWACVIYDRYWSLFLGRPLTMKSVDLEIYSLSDQFERLGTCMPAGPGKSLNTRIYEALLDLMEIAGKMVEPAEFRKISQLAHRPDQQAYFKMAALDRELHNWASRLPNDLRDSEENRANAPLSFFLLHQQYHAVLILLHRPFTCYDDQSSTGTEELSALDSHFSQASREVCTKSAVAMARIFWQHRQKFDGKKIFCSGMQHAGTAATALIAALAYANEVDRNNNMQYLEVLHHALQDMAHTYQPAERMAAVLNAVMLELRGGPSNPGPTMIEARRSRETMEAERGDSKRRQTSSSNRQARAIHQPSYQLSGASMEQAVYSQQQQSKFPVNQNDYAMSTPRSGNPSWPNMHTPERVHGLPMLPTSHPTSIMHSTDRPQSWAKQPNSHFTQGPLMPGMFGMSNDDPANVELFHLPPDYDWKFWHSDAAAYLAGDLYGFAPRGT